MQCCLICGYHILSNRIGRKKFYCSRCGQKHHVTMLGDCKKEGTKQEVFI